MFVVCLELVHCSSKVLLIILDLQEEKNPMLCKPNTYTKLTGVLFVVGDNVLSQSRFLEYFYTDRIIDVS